MDFSIFCVVVSFGSVVLMNLKNQNKTKNKVWYDAVVSFKLQRLNGV